MNNKQNLIFFLGVALLIFVFFMSGNARILWDAIFNGPKTLKGSPGNPGVSQRAPYVPSKPGICQKGFYWDVQLNACVPHIGIGK